MKSIVCFPKSENPHIDWKIVMFKTLLLLIPTRVWEALDYMYYGLKTEIGIDVLLLGKKTQSKADCKINYCSRRLKSIRYILICSILIESHKSSQKEPLVTNQQWRFTLTIKELLGPFILPNLLIEDSIQTMPQ